jgi:flagellar assembly protein FliH
MPSLSKARVVSGTKGNTGNVQEFEYQAGGSPEPGVLLQATLPPGAELLWEEPHAPSLKHALDEEEVKRREREAWEQGFQEAEKQTRAKLEKALAEERAALAAALAEFARGREDYYQQIESEIVKLVLSIARKVLDREAHVDPMLLRGIVRVALEKMANGSVIKLRVPLDQAEGWRSAVRPLAARDLKVEICADERLVGPRCVIVTEAGETDASLDAQLEEIERGFVDLLTHHPSLAAVTTADR